MPTYSIDRPGFKMEAVNIFTKKCTDCCNRNETINIAVFQPNCESLSPKLNCSKVEEFGPFFKVDESTWISGCGTTYIYQNYIQLSNTTVPNSATSNRSTSGSFMLLFYGFVLYLSLTKYHYLNKSILVV